MTRSHPGAMPEVAVTGLGLVTPAGVGVSANWQRVLSGEPCARPDEELSRDGGLVRVSCRAPDPPPSEAPGRVAAWQLERFVQLAVAAAWQAVRDAGLNPEDWDGARVGVVLGNSLGGPATFEQQRDVLRDAGPTKVSPLLVTRYMPNMVAGYVAIELGVEGPSLVAATACASGATAVGVARQLLAADSCDVVLAGASESALTPTVVTGLARMGALDTSREPASRPFDAARNGFVVAEGAGVLVLERVDDARARGATVRATVRGFGSTTDAHHATSPHPEGRGAEAAVRQALADAGADPGDVGHVNAHGTGTVMNDLIEGRMLRRVFGDGPAVTSTKGVTGHALAAAGAIEAAYTVLAVQHGAVPPTANLTKQDPDIELDVVAGQARTVPLRAAVSTSLGFGGHNAALVFARA